MTYYSVGVYGGNTAYFDVTVGLYNEHPRCGTLIPGTKRTFTDIPNYGSPVFITATFDSPIDLPSHFWMVVKFSDSSCGWFQAGAAEIGYSLDMFARCDPPWNDYSYGGDPNPYASFWADIGSIPVMHGACCLPGHACVDETQEYCGSHAGYYQGYGTACAATDCNVAPGGACCRYENGTCSQVSPEFCNSYGGVYHGDGTSCGAITCPFGRYRNEGSSCYYYQAQGDSIGLADDMTLAGSGARELVYYNLLVYGGWSCEGPGDGPFDVTTELWTACPGEGGTYIEGTSFTWLSIPDDASTLLLEADLSGSPVTIPDTVWMVARFSTGSSGWVLGRQAEVGSTQDRYGVDQPPWQCNERINLGHIWPWAGFWANLRCVEEGGGRRDGTPPILSVTPMPLDGVIVPVGSQQVESREPATPEKLLDPKPLGAITPFVAPILSGRREGGSVPLFPAIRDLHTSERVDTPTVTLRVVVPRSGEVLEPGEVFPWNIEAAVSESDNAGLALVLVDLVQDSGNPRLFNLSPATVGPEMTGFDRPAGIANPEPGGSASAYGGTPVGPDGAKNLVQIGGAQNTFGEPGETIGLDCNVDPSIGQAGWVAIASGYFVAPAACGSYTFHLENGVANVLTVMPPPTPPDYWPVVEANVIVATPSFGFDVCEVTDPGGGFIP